MVAWVAGGRVRGLKDGRVWHPQSAGPVTCRGRSPEARAAAGGEYGTAGGVAPRREERGDHELRVRRQGAPWPARAASRRGRPHAGQEGKGQGLARAQMGGMPGGQAGPGRRSGAPVPRSRRSDAGGAGSWSPEKLRRTAGALPGLVNCRPARHGRPGKRSPAAEKAGRGDVPKQPGQRAAAGGGRRRARNGRARQASWLPHYLGKDPPAREAAPAKPGTGAEFGE